MFKKISYKSLNYGDLDKFQPNDLKRDALHSFYQTFDFLELIESWPEIVGLALSKVTSPLKIKGDLLIIVSKHSSYSQNISFLSEEIKENIFKLFPKLRLVIKKLNFQTQENFFSNKDSHEKEKKAISRYHPQDPTYKILKIEAERLFSNLDDQELKNLLISIFIQSYSS
jgi:hypothetical protein